MGNIWSLFNPRGPAQKVPLANSLRLIWRYSKLGEQKAVICFQSSIRAESSFRVCVRTAGASSDPPSLLTSNAPDDRTPFASLPAGREGSGARRWMPTLGEELLLTGPQLPPFILCQQIAEPLKLVSAHIHPCNCEALPFQGAV